MLGVLHVIVWCVALDGQSVYVVARKLAGVALTCVRFHRLGVVALLLCMRLFGHQSFNEGFIVDCAIKLIVKIRQGNVVFGTRQMLLKDAGWSHECSEQCSAQPTLH
jgi:hypothetical protein